MKITKYEEACNQNSEKKEIMLGKSIYLSNLEHNFFETEESVDICFTSMHIIEEFSEDYGKRVGKLLESVRKAGKKIITDISSRGLEALGYDSLEQFAVETGVYMIRSDFGIKEEEMLRTSKYCALAVNASTLDYQFASRLRKAGAEVWAIHNFYPRPETGLDEEFFMERNIRLKELGIKTAAFITGDVKKRGPLKEGLPTLEFHRNLPPYVQYLQMTEKYEMDMVLVGDPGLSDEEMKLIERKRKENVISVPVDLERKYQDLYGKVWNVREDSPKWVARLKESRGYAAIGKKIEVENCKERLAGSITIDNEKYLRYSGEIQIVRENLKADERVNVIGRVQPKYQSVLGSICRGKKIVFVQ